jgi:hypothetical protein
MAKQPNLTINVNSQQFKQFATQFNAFSGQIKNMNAQFSQINASLNRSNILIRSATASMTPFLYAARSVHSVVSGITKKLLSWGTIVGGVTALLGMGGGLFGIERLAASIMAKRRMTLGLGQDYGRTQASMIFRQGMTDSPGNVMKNIRMGMAGSSDQMTALMGLGINPFDPSTQKLSPDELMDKIEKRIPDILNRAGKGRELMMAQSYKLESLGYSPMDLLRRATPEGQKEIEEERQLKEKYAPLMVISKAAQKAWTELELQFQAAKSQLESVFGEKLADLAEPLKHLSEGFTQLVRTLMQSPAVQAVIKQLAEWIDTLAKKMKELTEDDIQKFITKIETLLPTMEQFKTAMKDFVEVLQAAVSVLRFIKDLVPGGGTMAGAAQATGAGAVHGWLGKHLTPYGKELLGFDSGIKGSPTSASAATAGGNVFNAFGGRGGGFSGSSPGLASGFGWQHTLFNQGLAPESGTLPSSIAGPWSSAASKMAPPKTSGGDGSIFGPVPDAAKGGKAVGPLSMDNWQMNRTASLVVRNVPGANIFMTAAGMTG